MLEYSLPTVATRIGIPFLSSGIPNIHFPRLQCGGTSQRSAASAMKPHPETQTARAEEVPWAEKILGEKCPKIQKLAPRKVLNGMGPPSTYSWRRSLFEYFRIFRYSQISQFVSWHNFSWIHLNKGTGVLSYWRGDLSGVLFYLGQDEADDKVARIKGCLEFEPSNSISMCTDWWSATASRNS